MTVPAYSHIVVVVEENHNFDEIIGNTAEAPFINSLAAGGAVLANMHATTHPSQPNYFALYAGSTFGTASDALVSEPDPTLATILQAAGDSFTGFVDQSDSDINHNPWESFPEGWSVQTDFGPTTSYPLFSSMFPSGDYASLPSVSFVIPGIYNDMHSGTIQEGDSWLQQNLAGYAQWAVNNNSLLIVVWDENDDDQSSSSEEPSNQIPAIIYGAGVVPGAYTADYNDYNVLSTILAAFGLTGPNNAATAATIGVFDGDGETISTAVAGPVTLSAADDPLLVTSTGSVTATGSGNDGIDGPSGAPWAIDNEGGVSSAAGFGIKLAAGGAVSNGLTTGAGALISGGLTGIGIYSSAGNVINDGSISGAAYSGVVLGGTTTPFVYASSAGSYNSVTNSAGASISGRTNGVKVAPGTTATITNAGTISASDGAGVYMAGGGGVTNSQGGTITGSQFGVFIGGGPGTITNAGSIGGVSYDGIVLGDGGSVTNAAGATITGGSSGVYVKYNAPGAVTNAGTIIGAGGDALFFADGGSLSNAAGGMITSAANGVVITGGAGTLSNSGTIAGSATSGYGVILGAGGTATNAGAISGRDGLGAPDGGTLVNAAGASVAGLGPAAVGVFISGAAGTLSNAGGITGTHLGMLVESGGTITNSGSISGGATGVFSNDVPVTVLNSGTISGTTDAALDLEGGATVTNSLGATLSSGECGVFVTGGTGTLVNSGSISGGSGFGVLFEAGGQVTNAALAAISGADAGFFSNDVPATLANAGTITASAETAADLEGGGSVANAAGGVLSGGEYGVFVVGGTGAVANSGAITGTRYDGVVLSDGGSLTNSAGGAITGGSSGIYVKSGASGSVTNSGSIGGTTGAGIELASGGAIVNNATASITGGGFGVLMHGGTVTNAGTITAGNYAISGADRLIVNPGAVFNGDVAGDPDATIELAAGGAGSIGGIVTSQYNVSQFDFQTLDVDSGANWTLTGANNNVGDTVVDGTLAVSGSLDGGVLTASATGAIQLDAGATLDVAQVGAQPPIEFLGSDMLVVNSATAFGVNVGTTNYAGPLLEGFAAGDTIDVQAFPVAGIVLNYNATSGLLQLSDTAGDVATLAFQPASLGSGSFHSANAGSGVLITHS